MSGYRSLHRQQILGSGGSVIDIVHNEQQQEQEVHDEHNNNNNDSVVTNEEIIAIWNIKTTPLLQPQHQKTRNTNHHHPSSSSNSYRIWVASSDGYIRTYIVHEKKKQQQQIQQTTISNKNDNDNHAILADASALQLQYTHILVGPITTTPTTTVPQHEQQQQQQQQTVVPPVLSQTMGCTQVSTMFRYHDDNDNGSGSGNTNELVVLSLNIMGTIRIWILSGDLDYDSENEDENGTTLGSSSTTVIPTTSPTDTATTNFETTISSLPILPPQTETSLRQQQEQPLPIPKSMITATIEFTVPNATGTTAILCSPSFSSYLIHHHEINQEEIVVEGNNNNNTNNSNNTNIKKEIMLVAIVGCLDGTIVFVSTGVSTTTTTTTGSEQQQIPKTSSSSSTTTLPAGTIITVIGNPGSSSLPISMTLYDHSTNLSSSSTNSSRRDDPITATVDDVPTTSLAIGRQDGSIDIIRFHCWIDPTKKNQISSATSSSNNNNYYYQYKLIELMGSPVRGVAFTPDGQLITGGNDDGTIGVWDNSPYRGSRGGGVDGIGSGPVLVKHVQQAHNSHSIISSSTTTTSGSSCWILNIGTLPTDSQRFISVGTDHNIHIWKYNQIYKPVHTFQNDYMVWTFTTYSSSLSTSSNQDITNESIVPSKSSSSTTTNQKQDRLICGTENGWLLFFSLE